MEKKMTGGSVVILSVVLIATLLVAVIGATYAYFKAQVITISTSSIEITTAELSIQYEDTDTLVGTDITPGWTDSKEFTIENIGTATAEYIIAWSNVTNELINKTYMKYTLSSTGGDGKCATNTAQQFPNTDATTTICEGTVLVGTANKQTYTLTVTYENDVSFNQSSDMGANVAATINVIGKQVSQVSQTSS